MEARCTVDELSEFGVREIVGLLTKRMPRPDWNAIYFASPDKDSVKAIIADFKGKMYGAPHIFFTSALPDYLFDEFKTSGMVPHIAQFIELEISFVPLESRVFHIDVPEAIQELYGATNLSEVDFHIEAMAKRFRAVLATLNEDPLIRYYDPDGGLSTFSAKLAFALQHEMMELKKFDKSFPVATPYDDQGPATLILVDRASDLISPLIHTLSYQALVMDLFEVVEDVDRGYMKLQVEVDSGNGQVKATVDEGDKLFNSIRHKFFVDAFETVKKAVADFQAYRDKAGGLEVLKDKMMSIPEKQKEKAQLDAIVALNSELNEKVLVQRKLKDISLLEQALAVGEDEGRTATRKLLEEIVENELIQPDDKLRLIAIYILTMDGLTPADRDKLADLAGMEHTELAALEGLKYFGVNLASPYTRQSRRTKGGGGAGSTASLLSNLGLSGLLGGDAAATGAVASSSNTGVDPSASTYSTSADSTAFDMFEPAVSYIIRDALEGTLSQQIFPYVEEPSKRNKQQGIKTAVREPGDISRGKGTIVDFKSGFRARWGRSRPRAVGDLGEDFRSNGPRTIVFVVGGLSYLEMRVTYLLSMLFKREIFIGSTHIVTPTDFVEVLHFLGGSEHGPLSIKSSNAELPAPPTSLAPPTEPPPRSGSSLGYSTSSSSIDVQNNSPRLPRNSNFSQDNSSKRSSMISVNEAAPVTRLSSSGSSNASSSLFGSFAPTNAYTPAAASTAAAASASAGFGGTSMSKTGSNPGSGNPPGFNAPPRHGSRSPPSSVSGMDSITGSMAQTSISSPQVASPPGTGSPYTSGANLSIPAVPPPRASSPKPPQDIPSYYKDIPKNPSSMPQYQQPQQPQHQPTPSHQQYSPPQPQHYQQQPQQSAYGAYGGSTAYGSYNPAPAASAHYSSTPYRPSPPPFNPATYIPPTPPAPAPAPSPYGTPTYQGSPASSPSSSYPYATASYGQQPRPAAYTSVAQYSAQASPSPYAQSPYGAAAYQPAYGAYNQQPVAPAPAPAPARQPVYRQPQAYGNYMQPAHQPQQQSGGYPMAQGYSSSGAAAPYRQPAPAPAPTPSSSTYSSSPYQSQPSSASASQASLTGEAMYKAQKKAKNG
ncbi:vacuolar sorting protein VPS33/slp1 [Blyttiomyces sp. JEL0837]|nr:vacuolar sorting protein VPS33/slp1 [Blyttiomyces sp. JEL0837]